MTDANRRKKERRQFIRRIAGEYSKIETASGEAESRQCSECGAPFIDDDPLVEWCSTKCREKLLGE